MKKPKTPKPKKIRRNPHARALAIPLFRQRVEKAPDTYARRLKHGTKPDIEDSET
jgi:stalled ribosome alternative rescue factor ArfA